MGLLDVLYLILAAVLEPNTRYLFILILAAVLFEPNMQYLFFRILERVCLCECAWCVCVCVGVCLGVSVSVSGWCRNFPRNIFASQMIDFVDS